MDKKTLTRQDLYQQVWKKPLIQLAKFYNVSDNELRKKCKKYKIPLPPSGYWSKVKYGRKINIPPLPKMENISDNISLFLNEKFDLTDRSIPFKSRLYQQKYEIESNKNLPLKFPEKITNSDKYIIATRDYLTNQKGNERLWLRNKGENILDIQVSNRNKKRALLIMDYFIKLIKALGHDIIIDSGNTKLLMYGTTEEISIREKYVSSESSSEVTSLLVFRAGYSYHKRWEDTKTKPLENKIINIIAHLEIKARELRACWDLNEKRRKEEEERKRIQKEIEDKKKNELIKFDELLDEASRWHKVKILREYINFLESNKINNHDEQDNWIDWAKNKADWYDPLCKKNDPTLGKYIKNNDNEYIN